MAKTVKFEEALKKLEGIVDALENGELDLDKSLGLFEEGVKLARFCSNKLEETKRKIEIIEKKGSKTSVKRFDDDIREGTEENDD